MSAPPIWYAKFRHADDARPEVSIVGVASDEFADGSVVDLSGLYDDARLPPRWLGLIRCSPDGRSVSRLLIRGHGAQDATPLWFLQHAEPEADPAAHTIVAFTGGGIEAGRVLSADDVLAAGLSGSDQVGAIRWWTESGQIHQIYVQPDNRRNGIGRALLFAAAGVRVSRGWPRLWADGQRTDLGEAFALGGQALWQHRFEKRTHNLAPMTPTYTPAEDHPA